MGRKKLTKKATSKALFLIERADWKAFKLKCKSQGLAASWVLREFVKSYIISEGD